MAIRNIVKIGDEILAKKCKPVDKVDAKVRELLDDMIETMRNADGLGIAAPQVGVLKQVAVIQCDGKIIELINPQIIEKHGKIVDIEGCLSVPNKFGEVARPKSVIVATYDRNGDFRKLHLDELCARTACHEIDHLNGELFLNKVIRFVEK